MAYRFAHFFPSLLSYISVILPAKNAAEFIADTIASIQNQSIFDWECICVDDGSEDHTLEILESFSKSDHRIKVLSNPGVGVISALRFGYEQSTGRFITRMDADDLMPQKKLEILKDELIRVGKGNVVTGKVKYFNTLGQGFLNYEYWLNSLVDSNTHWNELYKECVIASPNWMIHREDLDEANAFTPETYPEDYDLVFRFYQQGFKVASVNAITHLWRDHENRASRNSELYADNTFIPLKVNYFKKLSWNSEKTILLWGAGKKGKILAKALQSEEITFKWLTNNPKKIGHEIYGVKLESADLELCPGNQVIVAVSGPEEQNVLLIELEQIDLRLGQDYFVMV